MLASKLVDVQGSHWYQVGSSTPLGIHWPMTCHRYSHPTTSAMIDDICFRVASTWFYLCPKVLRFGNASPNCFASSRLKIHPQYEKGHTGKQQNRSHLKACPQISKLRQSTEKMRVII
jgi:hypothetical protein